MTAPLTAGQGRLPPELTVSGHLRASVAPGASRRARLLTVWWAVFALFTLLSVLPGSWGFAGWPLLLQPVSFPLAFGIGLGLLGAVLGARASRRSRRDRRKRIVIATVIALVGVTQVATVLARGWWSAGSPAQPGDVVVVSFNSADILPLPAELVEMVATIQPDIIALPETSREMADGLAAGARQRGLDYQVFSAPTQSAPPSTTSLLVADSFGGYQLDRLGSAASGAVRVVPVSGVGPVVVAVHPTSPARIGLDASGWRSAGDVAVAQCAGTPGAIVAGDFNATIGHPQFSGLGSCRDAAAQMRRSGEGTWPAWAPAPFASAIDHVLVDGTRWQVINFGTHRVGPSDHRMVVSTIRAR